MCGERKASGPEGPSVTNCRPDDLPEVEQILKVSSEAADWSAEALADALRRHPTYFFVSRAESRIAGFVCGRVVANEAEILNLAIRPELRNRGIGKELVSKLLHTFTLQGVAQVFLEVRKSNATAIAFYHRLGFRQVGERPGYYQNPPEPALVLARKPASPDGRSSP